MQSVKATMIDIIARQPEDSTYDEILRELAYARLIQNGLRDGDAGRTISNQEMQRKLDSWRQ